MSSQNRLILRYTFRYPLLAMATIVMGFSGALFNGVSTALIAPLILGFLGQEFNFRGGPPILQRTLGIFDGFSGDARLLALTGAVILAIILKNLTNYLNAILSVYLSMELTRAMRLEALRLLLDVDMDFFAKHKLGDIMNRFNDEINRTSTAVRTLLTGVTQILTILVFLAILVSISWQLTVISTILLLFVSIFNQFFVERAKKFGRQLTETGKQQTNKVLEILTGIRLIKTVSTEDIEYRNLEQFIRLREKASLQSQANFGAAAPINEVAGIIALLSIVLMGRFFFLQQLQSVGTILLTYLVVLFRLLPVVGQLNSMRSRYANQSYSIEVVNDFIRRDNKMIMANGEIPYEKLQAGIRFEEVNFNYPEHDRQVLNAVDLWIPRGKTTAFVGTSGAGKSTLVDLVPRFYDPVSGRITLDGVDLRDYDFHTLRQRIGAVSQDTFLFNNSVRFNIAYGRDQATDEEVFTAAKRANAYDFIMELPEGFETEVGDRGVMLSGGQRQRLAIARALLRDPDILILDEATSALDTVSERLVQEAIEELCRDRTTLVIAHRLSTIQRADQIVVMEQGQVIEVGNHEQLLAKEGKYANLYEMQFSTKPKRPRIVLPTNEALIRASIRASHELRTRLSYEVRSRLNSMLGSLQLVTDDLIDTPEEQQELIAESYESALKLLDTIAYFEANGARLSADSNHN
ncbi:MAG: ABC transporter ATP-binding protein [Spirulinaceae cyanobacterium SM2_1_0]|nr:ABC transporter ATP-binding protein [Spirulinaceae cyanobacterium SM2_1_0]